VLATLDEVALWHGDCLEVMANIPDGSVDMILADLPYGSTACRWDSVIPLDALWSNYRRVLRSRGVVALTAIQPFTSTLVMSRPAWFRHEWIWEKDRGSNFALTKYQPMREHESVLIFGEGAGTYNPIPEQRAPSGAARVQYLHNDHTETPLYSKHLNGRRTTQRSEMRCPRSIQRFKGERGLHPTQKPIALGEYLIRTYTTEGETVLDNTMGSGSFGVAAIRAGRRFIGIEREEKYFRIAEQRIREAQVPKGSVECRPARGRLF
jgi:site-specific DNA-methyltransferase (adenine-specific)